MEQQAREQYAEIISRGETMRGMVHWPASQNSTALFRAVIMCHGFTGNRVEPHRLFVKTARALARQNIVVARFDYIGSGESDGNFEDMTVEREIEDTIAITGWLGTQNSIDQTRLGLIGFSLGGLVAVSAAARLKNVDALCLWSPVAELHTWLENRLGKEVLENPGPGAEFWGNRVGAEYLRGTVALKPLEYAKEFKGRALIVHGSSDMDVPIAEGKKYEIALSQCAAEFHVVAGAGHTYDRSDWEQELIAKTCSWFGF